MNTSNPAKLVIHRGSDRPGRYVWSPFVTKVEFRHRLSGLSYTCGAGGPIGGPKGKIPWVELSVPEHEPEVLADSSLIATSLIAKDLMYDMNARLSARDRGYDLAIRAMLEEKLFYYNIHERWLGNFYIMRDYTMAKMQFPQRAIFGYLAFRGIVRRLHDQGTSRFSDNEIHSFRRNIWESVNAFLDNSRQSAGSDECFWVLGGDQPSEADATVYGFIVSTLIADAGPISKQLVKTEFPTVVEYATRIHCRYFPDYEVWK
ncbi:hypothetical protein CC86DRAFT_354227 [Ophiobolus disseminans]|uniref:Thioredoxin-like fold domain-containing protein n=1 Tax=Ophiobolus disseminans TaxID=1469910 RepID=A0A6A6ZU03_9PLEO|nr:hypothetical protein CC86DRAFT_354227 [Ophiobolus disseminans]